MDARFAFAPLMGSVPSRCSLSPFETVSVGLGKRSSEASLIGDML